MRRTLPLLLLLAAACTDRPKAPPLTDEAVFRDDVSGLRFLAPAGWAMQSRATVPAGGLGGRTVVVASYRRVTASRPATFEVLAAEVPADADPERFLAAHGTGLEKWAPRGPAQPVQVNGAAATRFVQGRAQG